MWDGLKRIITPQDAFWQKCMQEAELRNRHTPDWNALQTHEGVPIFIYDSHMKNQPNNSVLGEGILYFGAAWTESSQFVMYKKMLGKDTFPLAMQIEEDQVLGLSSLLGDPGQVMGELYAVRPNTIAKLDEDVLNLVYYERKMVKIVSSVTYSTGILETKVVEAFMYVGRRKFWEDQMRDEKAKHLFQRSPRLFCSKDRGEGLGAYYTFDYKVEAHAP
jgi:gamma-glutamylcyclotransferase (GGCT)/AIG2-like uncharacterized protein YtfP